MPEKETRAMSTIIVLALGVIALYAALILAIWYNIRADEKQRQELQEPFTDEEIRLKVHQAVTAYAWLGEHHLKTYEECKQVLEGLEYMP